MSNNKQSMKLYTEEQIRKFLTTKQSFITLDDMENLESMQLPSDEEIDEAIFPHMELNIKVGFIEGAKWMRDKIQGGNNEQQ